MKYYNVKYSEIWSTVMTIPARTPQDAIAEAQQMVAEGSAHEHLGLRDYNYEVLGEYEDDYEDEETKGGVK